MDQLIFDHTHARQFVGELEVSRLAPEFSWRTNGCTGHRRGSDFLGWIDLPVNYDRDEFNRIKEAAACIRDDSEVLVVIGIGGSYLGARAAIDALSHSFLQPSA